MGTNGGTSWGDPAALWQIRTERLRWRRLPMTTQPSEAASLARQQRPRRLWRYAWAFPATAVGLCLAGVARTGGATVNRVDGVLEVAGGAFGRAAARLPAPFRFCAITFGHVVIGVDHCVLAQCRTHSTPMFASTSAGACCSFLLYAASSVWEKQDAGAKTWRLGSQVVGLLNGWCQLFGAVRLKLGFTVASWSDAAW